VIGGLAAIVVAVVIGLVLVQRVGTTYRDGLDVAAESARLLGDAAGPINEMTTDLVDFAGTADSGITDARSLLQSAGTSLDQLGAAARDDLALTAEGLASLGDRVAGVLETIEGFIPGNRDSTAEDLRKIAEGLEPVPAELRELGTQLQQTATELREADPTLAAVATSVGALGDDLEALEPSVVELGTAATRLVGRVDAARDRVDLDLWLARIVVVLVGAVLAIGLWVGWRRGAPILPPDDAAAVAGSGA
jgi:ABC-type transporter Mla subunit MlaD